MAKAHNLMTKTLAKQIPELYAQDGKGDKAKVYTKYFHPWSSYRCYVLEFDGQDTLFVYASIDSVNFELGYASLSEHQRVRVRGLKMERDLYFSKKTLGELKKDIENGIY